MTGWRAGGGEEFLIFINGGDLATGMQPMNRIHEMLNAEPFRGPPDFPVTMSFGIVTSGNTSDIDTLLSKADALMYDAKNSGRNRIMWERHDQKIWFTNNIRAALADGRITPVYAPVRDWDGRVSAVNIGCGLREETADEARKMLLVAGRLRLRLDVDLALLKKTADELPAKSNTPFFFPVNDELIAAGGGELMPLFKRFPYLRAAASADAPLSAESIRALTAAKARLAIVDFSPARAPLDLLATGVVSHLIFSAAAAEAAAVLPLLPSGIICYTGGESAESAKPQRDGFAGWLSPHPLDGLGEMSEIVPPDKRT